MYGYINLHRQVKENWIFQEKRTFSKFEAWIDLLMMAYYKDTRKLWKNKLIDVKRGQCITSFRHLAKEWNWGKDKVRSFLKLLEEESMIILRADTSKTVITIVNYDLFQFDVTKTRHTEEEAPPKTRHQQGHILLENNQLNQGFEETEQKKPDTKTDTNQTRTRHNIKKEKHKDISPSSPQKMIKKHGYPEGFQRFWKEYPKRVEKKTSFDLWKKIVEKKEATPEELLLSAINYTKFCTEERRLTKYIKNPTTFLGPTKYYQNYIDTVEEEEDKEEKRKSEKYVQEWQVYSEYPEDKEKFEEWYRRGADANEIKRRFHTG